MTVYTVPNTSKPEAFSILRKATNILLGDGVRVVADASLQGALPGTGIDWLQDGEGFDAADIVLTIGGDGTMLHTARHVETCQKPMLGINIGNLGFLAIVEVDELDKLHRLANGEYCVENRTVLQVAHCGKTSYALNDAVLFKQAPEKTIALDIFCDEVLVSSFRGDGVIFATPTGSTAYSMSAGGPIVDANLDALLVTQICAHVIHMPPMVFSASRTLRVVQQPGRGDSMFLSCDGLESQGIDCGQELVIRQSGRKVQLVQFADADQLKSIDRKLKGR